MTSTPSRPTIGGCARCCSRTSPRRMRALRGRVETLTTGLLDELAATGPPADLHAALALPLPIAVICELLGVPYDDRAQFRAWTQAAGDLTDRARSEQGLAELFTYGRKLMARKRAEGDPDADVISRLAATPGVSDDEAAAMGMFLLFAGHETTVAAIDEGALWLLANPQQWQALMEDPSRIDAAVEEILRAPGQGGGGIPATPAPTWRSPEYRYAPAIWCCWTQARPTTTRPSSPTPTASTSTAPPYRI
nr:hypothetical protein GCM10020093_031980 [Planobispora longispora]